jgi:beta-lactamase superfamily II metal-dependent hydrolase
MKCEVEFLPVGSASKAGDAIVLRYGEVGAYSLMLVDGGHVETGEQIVSHLRGHFGERVFLEHVVLTHSDGDHASGLRTVLEEIPVRNLWLHIPWFHANETLHLFADKTLSGERLAKKIKDEYPIISEIVELAEARNTNIQAAFQGASIGPFRVLSPQRDVYNLLLPQFEKTPDPDQGAIEAAGFWIGKESLVRKIFEAAKAAVGGWIEESWQVERLRDGGITSASNESSVILYGTFDNNERYLLTGDTGNNGLWWAANYADSVALPLQQFTFVQIPHHGSRRNIGPTTLTRLVGPKLSVPGATTFDAFVSVPPDDSRHPRLIVLNAFTRRGGRVMATQGKYIVHWGGFPARPGYGPGEAHPLYNEVEEYT